MNEPDITIGAESYFQKQLAKINRSIFIAMKKPNHSEQEIADLKQKSAFYAKAIQCLQICAEKI